MALGFCAGVTLPGVAWRADDGGRARRRGRRARGVRITCVRKLHGLTIRDENGQKGLKTAKTLSAKKASCWRHRAGALKIK